MTIRATRCPEGPHAIKAKCGPRQKSEKNQTKEASNDKHPEGIKDNLGGESDDNTHH